MYRRTLGGLRPPELPARIQATEPCRVPIEALVDLQESLGEVKAPLHESPPIGEAARPPRLQGNDLVTSAPRISNR